MTVFIDISELYNVNFISGIQRVVIEVVSRWIDADEEVMLGVYYPDKDAFALADNREFADYYRHRRKDKAYLTDRYLPVTALDSNYIFFDMDSVWMNENKRGYFLKRLSSQGVRLAVQIYDIIPITHPQYCHKLTSFKFIDYLAANIENAELIIANANATIKDIRKITEGTETKFSTAVVKLGSDFSKRNDVPADEVRKRSPRTAAVLDGNPYVLMVGTLEPRKNHAYVLDAFDKALFDEGLNLVFVGRYGWHTESLVRRIEKHPLYNKQLFMIKNAADYEVQALYKNAFLVAFASFNEGFGLPIIESFNHGVPVLASDIPVLRETGGEYAEYFSLENVDDFIKKVKYYAENRDEYEDMRKRISGFHHTSWDECAASMMNEIKKKFM